MKRGVIAWFLKNYKNFLVLFVSFFAFLLFLELVNYLFFLGMQDYYVWPPNLDEIFLPNSTIMNGVSGKSYFTINELGYRGPLIKNKEEEYRILTVGGSTTECLYLDNSETWPNLIMERLNMTQDGKGVIVMNIGKSGHNTRDHILQLEHLINIYEPDLVIFMVGANDMLLKLSKRWTWKPFNERSYDYAKSFSYISDYNLKLTLTYKIYIFFYSQFHTGLTPQDSVGNTIAESRLDRKKSNSIINATPDLGIVLEDYERNINRLIEISRASSASVLFATQPYLWKENMSEEEDSSLWMPTDFNGNFYTTEVMINSMKEFNFRLAEVCAKNKEILCLDLEKNIPKSLDYFYDDMHFNEKGAKLVARQFAEFIESNLREF